MSSLTLQDEQRFNRDLRVLMAGGLSSGLVGALLISIAGGHQDAMMALSFAGLVGTFSALMDGESEGETPLLRVMLAMIGGLVAATAFPNPVFAAVMGGAVLGLALSLESEWRETLLSMAGLAVALGAGFFSSSTLLESGLLGSIETPLFEYVAQGGIWGTFSVLGAGATQLRLDRDPHAEQLREAIDEVGDDEAHYLREADRLYDMVRREAATTRSEDLRDKSRRIAVHVLEALEALARRSSELRDALADHPDETLKHRIETLEDRIERTSEASIRRELEAARADLVEQSEMRERLETAITRLELRQQRCVTALERLHIHLVQESSIETAERELDASLEDLEDMADEISWRNLSIDTLCDPFEGEDLEEEIEPDFDDEFEAEPTPSDASDEHEEAVDLDCVSEEPSDDSADASGDDTEPFVWDSFNPRTEEVDSDDDAPASVDASTESAEVTLPPDARADQEADSDEGDTVETESSIHPASVDTVDS